MYCARIFNHDHLEGTLFTSLDDQATFLRLRHLRIDVPAKSKHILNVGGVCFVGSLHSKCHLLLCFC